MRLFHYTSHFHLAMIEADGELTTTESNLGAPPELAALMPATAMRRVGERSGPDVVWLFDAAGEPTLHDGGRMLRSGVDKRLVRIEVKLPDADVHRWPEWSTAHGIDRAWYKILARAGRPTQWYVVERPIPRDEWVNVETRLSVDDAWQSIGVER